MPAWPTPLAFESLSPASAILSVWRRKLLSFLRRGVEGRRYRTATATALVTEIAVSFARSGRRFKGPGRHYRRPRAVQPRPINRLRTVRRQKGPRNRLGGDRIGEDGLPAVTWPTGFRRGVAISRHPARLSCSGAEMTWPLNSRRRAYRAMGARGWRQIDHRRASDAATRTASIALCPLARS